MRSNFLPILFRQREIIVVANRPFAFSFLLHAGEHVVVAGFTFVYWLGRFSPASLGQWRVRTYDTFTVNHLGQKSD